VSRVRTLNIASKRRTKSGYNLKNFGTTRREISPRHSTADVSITLLIV